MRQAQGWAEAFVSGRMMFPAEEKRGLYGAGLGEFLAPSLVTEGLMGDLMGRFSDPLASAQYADYRSYLADDVLVKVDRMSMAHGLEVRSPLLDQDLVALGGRLPTALRRPGGEGKYLFKKLLEGDLPRDILYRSKQGFSVPLMAWFSDDWQALAHDLLFDGRLARRELFRMDRVHTLWRAARTPSRWRVDLGDRLWTLLNLELWHRMYIDGAAPPERPGAAPAPEGSP